MIEKSVLNAYLELGHYLADRFDDGLHAALMMHLTESVRLIEAYCHSQTMEGSLERAVRRAEKEDASWQSDVNPEPVI